MASREVWSTASLRAWRLVLDRMKDAMNRSTGPGLVGRIAAWVTRETTGGVLLLIAAVAGLLWANSPWAASYQWLSSVRFGPAAAHLDLTLAQWAADGLLAIFFFTVGAELKHEFVAGNLRDPRTAAVPMVAAVGGMAVPALLFTGAALLWGEPGMAHGWAVPTATDIAFAVAVLAVFGKGLPHALRTFLLTLAVVDDLLAIVVIAVFYTDHLDWPMLGLAVLGVGVFAVLVRLRRLHWWALLPVALATWVVMHWSGVHATIAGVALGMVLPARIVWGESETRTHRYQRLLGPVSSGIALPVFAFFSAGVALSGTAVFGQVVFVAVAVSLVVGKVLGVMGATLVVTRLTPLRLPDAIGMRDLLPVALLCGMGFTVSLLIAELSFSDGGHQGAAKAGVLGGTLVAAILGAALLRWDAHKARTTDMNEDGIPDVDTRPIGDEEPGQSI